VNELITHVSITSTINMYQIPTKDGSLLHIQSKRTEAKFIERKLKSRDAIAQLKINELKSNPRYQTEKEKIFVT